MSYRLSKVFSHSDCYYEKGAREWENLKIKNGHDNYDYKLGINEQHYLQEFFFNNTGIRFNDASKVCNILHIGAGSGNEINLVIHNIDKLLCKIINYDIVDISPSILSSIEDKIKKITNLSKLISSYNLICHDVTVESWYYKKPDNGHPLIVVLVANGYLFSHVQLLKNILRFMEEEDYLLVTTETSDEAKTQTRLMEISESYTISEAINVFNVSLQNIDINLNENDSKYFKFRYQSIDNDKVKYKEDFFEVYFNILEWIKERKNHDENFDYDINKYQTEIFENWGVKIFQSFKPSNLSNIEQYLDSASDLHSYFKLINRNDTQKDFNEPNKYNQVGLVIQKVSRGKN